MIKYYSALKRNEDLIHATWVNLKKHAKWQKPDTKPHILYDFISMEYPK